MGGCAGKFKSSDESALPEPLPTEAATSPVQAEREIVALENKEEHEKKQDEAPLVDISEPKQESENESSEPKTVEPENKDTTTSEDKVEATAVGTKEPEPEEKQFDAAPNKAEDNNTPLVTV